MEAKIQQANNTAECGIQTSHPISLSASENVEINFDPRRDSPSLEIDEVRVGIEAIAQLIVSGQLDNVGKAKNIDELSKQSKIKKAAIAEDIDDAVLRLRGGTKKETPAAPTIELSDGDKKRGKELSERDDIFEYFGESLTKIGYPVQSRVSCSVLMSLTCRLLDHSTAHFSYGPSSSGKSAVTLAALSFLPRDQYIIITSMSTQAAYYFGDDLKGKVVCMGEIKPFYEGEDDEKQMAIRQLISENKIIRSIPEKQADNTIKIVEKITEGPCSIIASTTLEPQSFNDELVNRGYWIQSDDSEETTYAALNAKAERAENPESIEKQKVTIDQLQREWQAFNSLLTPLPVVIPFAKQIIPKNKHVTVRRLYELLLDYVRCSALLHQHTRKIKILNGVRYVLASEDDYYTARELLRQNGPRTLESCSRPARKAIDKAKSAFGFEVFTQDQVTVKLSIPRATAQRYIKQWIADGLAKEEESSGGYSKQKRYQLTNDSGLGVQDLGLVAEIPAVANF